MNQDEIIEMAKEVGFDTSKPNRIIVRHSNGSWVSIKFELEAFAKLVAAKEREACAKVCEELAELSRTSNTDSMWEWGECAAAIRARGNV